MVACLQTSERVDAILLEVKNGGYDGWSNGKMAWEKMSFRMFHPRYGFTGSNDTSDGGGGAFLLRGGIMFKLVSQRDRDEK